MDKIKSLTHTGLEVPKIVKINKKANKFIIAPIVIEEQQVNNQKIYSWIELRVMEKNYNYNGVIDTLINLKYNLDEVLAIINNYMFDSSNEKYKKEFDELQEWRFIVKNIAKKHFNIL